MGKPTRLGRLVDVHIHDPHTPTIQFSYGSFFGTIVLPHVDSTAIRAVVAAAIAHHGLFALVGHLSPTTTSEGGSIVIVVVGGGGRERPILRPVDGLALPLRLARGFEDHGERSRDDHVAPPGRATDQILVKMTAETGVDAVFPKQFQGLDSVPLGHGEVRVRKRGVRDVLFGGDDAGPPFVRVGRRSRQSFGIFVFVVQEPRMVGEDVDLLGFVILRVSESVFEPLELGGVHFLGSGVIDEEDVVEDDVVGAVGPEGEVLVAEGGSEAGYGAGGGTIAHVVVSAQALMGTR